MYQVVLTVDQVACAALALLLLLAGQLAGRLAHRPAERVRRSARRTRLVLGAAGLVLAAKLVAVALLWVTGWDFVSDRVEVQLPLLVAAAAVMTSTIPRLSRLASGAEIDPADPRLVVPVQSTAVGAVLVAYVALVAQPVPPYLADLGPLAALLGVATALLWARQRNRASSPTTRLGRWSRTGRTAGVLSVLAGVLLLAAVTSRLPDRLNMAEAHTVVDSGGGPAVGHAAHGAPPAGPGTSVTELTGPRDGTPDASFTLTARHQAVRLTSGSVVDAMTFNGQLPGPELRVRQGDLVEVTLVNALTDGGVTVHWHGVDLPNAEDGVAGVTQDAVPPGGRHTYRFRAEQVGSYWYHSHQQSSEQVHRGLFGAIIVRPRDEPDGIADVAVLAHTWQTDRGESVAFGTADTVSRTTVPAGTPVRLRLTNTDGEPGDTKRLVLSGSTFRVMAIDGVDLHQPAEVVDTQVAVPLGGRYDLAFTMPANPVLLSDLDQPGVGLLLVGNGRHPPPSVAPDPPVLDASSYGAPAPTPFDTGSQFDRTFTMFLGDRVGFYDGVLGDWSTINGASFPDTPMLVVAKNDLVRITLVNRSHETHPMHLHGHHALVLSRNGRPVTGSPWWVDTLNLLPGESYQIAFRADNPGIWMDHCHNLVHASGGMTMHLAYTGVRTPFEIGRATGNQPE